MFDIPMVLLTPSRTAYASDSSLAREENPFIRRPMASAPNAIFQVRKIPFLKSA
jgi:hypothetical protein